MIQLSEQLPYLAIGINYEYGFSLSRVVTSLGTLEEVRRFLNNEAGGTDFFDEILIVKDDQVIVSMGSIEPERHIQG